VIHCDTNRARGMPTSRPRRLIGIAYTGALVHSLRTSTCPYVSTARSERGKSASTPRIFERTVESLKYGQAPLRKMQ